MADSLLYKPDWEQTKRRYLGWWNHEAIGRCMIGVFAPKKGPPVTPPPKAKTVEQQWYDLDLISAWQQYSMASTFYGGEALPVWNGGYPGHTGIPTFLGSPITLDWATGWNEPILTGEDIDYRSLRLNKEGRYYRFTLDLLRRGVQESKGKSLVTIGAFGGCGDTLAALRTSNQLLYDCMDRPDQVRAAEEFLMDMWIEVYSDFYNVITGVDEGSTCWFDLWSPGKFYASQNDFSYMISPKMLRDIFLPVIRRQTDFLTHSVYHVDGIAAFAHVDALCDLPHLQALQILPGAGKPSPLHYMDVLKKVQRRGKNLHISISINEVETALRELSARGLFIATRAETEDQARDLLKKAETWSKDR